MPQRNTVRHYSEGNYYHIYNRGVEKRLIFKDPVDYNYFTSILESYLTPKKPIGSISVKESRGLHLPYWRKQLEKDEIELVCYCLMPNHFHFLLKQNTKDAITKFMRRVSNAYVRYFNKKYDRTGVLFQGKFKSVLIDSDSYLLHLSRYIHLNPLEVGPLSEYEFSSYLDYLGKRNTFWVHMDIITSFFNKKYLGEKRLFLSTRKYSDYKFFVENYNRSSEEVLGDRILE